METIICSFTDYCQSSIQTRRNADSDSSFVYRADELQENAMNNGHSNLFGLYSLPQSCSFSAPNRGCHALREYTQDSILLPRVKECLPVTRSKYQRRAAVEI